MFIFIHTVKCGSHPLSKKVYFDADEVHYRKPQQTKLQKARGLVAPTHKW